MRETLSVAFVPCVITTGLKRRKLRLKGGHGNLSHTDREGIGSPVGSWVAGQVEPVSW
jgi:hypothetical protein